MNNIIDIYKAQGFVTAFTVKGGSEYGGPCPFCGGEAGKSDRFRIFPTENNGRGRFWCRKCLENGDNAWFYSKLYRVSLTKAREILGISDFSKYKPNNKPVKKPEYEGRKLISPGEKWQERAEKVVKSAHRELLENKNQLDWLKKRGINIDSVKKFRLGYFDKTYFREREAWGFKPKHNEGGRKIKFPVQAGLIIPIIKKDKVVGIQIRLKEPYENQNYLPVQGGLNSEPTIYSRVSKGYIVVESRLDGILIAQEAGDLITVLATGSTNYYPSFDQLPDLKKAICILVSMDFDKKPQDPKDQRPGAKASKWWLDNFQRSIRWSVPEGKDPGEAFTLGLDIKKWVLAGLPPAFKVKSPSYGHCGVDIKKEGEAENFDRPKHEEKIISVPLGTHPDVRRLYQIIEKIPNKIDRKKKKICGVNIIITDESLRVEIVKWFENSNNEKCCEISALVNSSDVFEFLLKHPEEKINKDNFWMYKL
ncbi:hypothetical protein KAR91_31135 [Candidatus Pacearchaeota archaeon]|nr:hypothetical protein [Candidatus Pacearchaeota archaeon]